MLNPYLNRPGKTFWKNAVADSSTVVPAELYQKKWQVNVSDQIATAGSCFAQHIGRNLKGKGFQVMDAEPPPMYLSPKDQLKFGYGVYSARYGNIYTTRQLLQLAKEAFGYHEPQDFIWRNDQGLFFDALRPGVEPEGLSSEEEVLKHRSYHISKVREMFMRMDLLVFTMGLTEAWLHKKSGTVYPTAPGTIAGSYDPNIYAFRNFTYSDVISDFYEFREIIRSNSQNKCKFLLTISPVPLTATASFDHVMVATVYSKSVLRAVAGELHQKLDDVDYFPSYEIITNPWSPTCFYEENLRSVKPEGVDHVMRSFFSAHLDEKTPNVHGSTAQTPHPTTTPLSSGREDDVVCEEAILEAFGERSI